MACIITYNNKKYTQPEFKEYFKSHFFEFAGDFIGSKQDAQRFKEFVEKTEQENNQILNSKEFQNFAKLELEKNPETSIEEILEYYKKCKK